MKIVQLVYHLGSGGAEKFVVNLSNCLAYIGHDVTVLQLRNDCDGFDLHFNRQFLSDKVNYINLELTKGYTISKAFAVMRAIRGLNPDIVHSHLNVLPYIYPLAYFSTRIKFIHTIHTVSEKENSILWQQKLNRWIYRNKYITAVTISGECRTSYVRLYNLQPPACIVNGTPAVLPSTNEHDVVSEINKLKKNPTSNIFLHVARFDVAKNQRLLIDAFNTLISDGLDAELLIIGNGFQSKEGQELQAIACEHIHFLGTKSNVGDYMLHSDYFIMSSLWEGLPISLIEAMSARLTPISTPAGGIVNVIEDGINGFLSKDFTTDNFIHTIKRALSSKINPEAIYSSFSRSYSIEVCARAYEQIYNE